MRMGIRLIDKLFGLKAWGLILYGALPANLALLGTLEIKLGDIRELAPLIVPISLLPIAITFLLIRNRVKNWYLTTDYLNLRSAVITFLTMLAASLISGGAGLMHGRYRFAMSNLFDNAHLLAISESFLMATCSLAITSALFLTILTRDTNAPAIPTTEWARLITEARNGLKRLRENSIWHESEFNVNATIDDVTKLRQTLEELVLQSDHYFTRPLLIEVTSALGCFITALNEIGNAGSKPSRQMLWNRHFAPSLNKPLALRPTERKVPKSGLGLLKDLKLD